MKNHEPPLILIAEDEEKIARLLEEYLQSFGYETLWLDNGLEVGSTLRNKKPDLLLLDIMLPGKDGMAVCQEIRKVSEVPIIMLTARVEEVDRILGLELGADDYICKPFSPREVVARVKSVLRRYNAKSNENQTDRPFKVDDERREIKVLGHILDLTPNEYSLLKVLFKRPGRVFTRDQLISLIYNESHFITDRTVDTHIKNVRKKLAAVVPGQEIIASIYGVGYKLEEFW